MEQEILNQIAEKEGYADWHELTEQNDPNTIYECTLKAMNQALSIANVVGQSEQLKPLPPNECKQCGVLIDYRLKECGDCGL